MAKQYITIGNQTINQTLEHVKLETFSQLAIITKVQEIAWL